ncbi:hypothetical protein Xcel_2070 [Xylanimonas cellulosilytica DSM 15894]|uniref:Uncharacterized protein n=1 Tax=Xylanimonas cellulosilytica (strain DSM 15894 / JCM 12276 / CECT 5975 / KCTC 9989 / LMG 20990 / NBRC 107835 / XIL07) TaxID=446471 RepID=D1BU75_XYLCX|nr:hypothetical protein [Xylanimonas cellulosilytica]ACZ31088.1 hypothetical protein Xcel_2070 [Xylanimonas cellulosilytica DSM 15894]
MTWTRLPDDFNDRPTMLTVSRSARLLHVEALTYCNRLLTDGLLPRAMLVRITDSPDPAADAAELVAAGLWSQVATGWLLDWADQESAERVRERLAFNAARQQRYRERGERHARGDHSICTDRCPARAGNASRNGVRDGSVTASVTATRSVPFRPLGRNGEGTGAGAPSAGAPGAPRQEKKKPAGLLHEEHRPDGSIFIPLSGWREG